MHVAGLVIMPQNVIEVISYFCEIVYLYKGKEI